MPAWKELGNLGPAITVLDMCRQNDAILLLAPDIFADVRIQMIVPSALRLERLHIQQLTSNFRVPLAALLADAARKILGNLRPVLGPKLTHKLKHLLVLLTQEQTE